MGDKIVVEEANQQVRQNYECIAWISLARASYQYHVLPFSHKKYGFQ